MKKVRWGVIGAGGIADRRTIPGMMLADNAELVSVMEVNQELAEKIRAKYQARRAYDSVDALLADPEIDAVYIATPVIFHKEQMKKAIAAKKHILIEKPAALSIEDGRQLDSLCKSAGVKAAAGLMMRFNSYHQKFKELIQSGKLGQIVSCRGQLTCWFPDMENNWRQSFATAGGGALMDMGVHCIDLIQYITGSKAKKVAALADTKTFRYEVEDSGSVLFQLENGANCYVDANFNVPDNAAECRLEFYGTKGSILASGTISQVDGGNVRVTLSDDSLEYNAQQNRNDSGSVELEVSFTNIYQQEIERFSGSILNDTPVEVPLADAIQVQAVVEAAYRSAKGGKWIEL